MAKVEAVHLSPTDEQLRKAQAAVSEYDFIRFTTADINGVPRGVLVPADSATKFLQSGIGCSGGVLAYSPTMHIYPKLVKNQGHCNVQVIPDLNTLHAVPWVEKYKVGQIMAEAYWNPTTPQEGCTRNIARRMLSQLDNMGLKFYSGMELECILINMETQLPDFSGDKPYLMLTQAEYEPWFYDVASNMNKAGVNIDTMHLEGRPGQFEFATCPKFGIEEADTALILKQGIKEMAIQRGWYANFMTTPFVEELGCWGHFNFSVWHNDSGKNAFWDETTEENISEFGKHWIAGTIQHAKALTALCCITTNCYRGPYTPLAPHQAIWGIEDKTVMLRIKNNSPEGTYMENRIATGPVNPYLVMAATIAAGLDGVNRELPCPIPHDVTEAVKLPLSLKEALDCLQEDTVMVEALGATFVEWFVQSKTEADLTIIEGTTDEGELIELERKQYAYAI